MNFNISLKSIVVIILLSACIGAGAVLYFQKPKVVEKQIQAEKPKHEFKQNPDTADFNTLRLWSKSPIETEYKVGKQTRNYTAVSVHAFDANKSTDQEIRVPVAECGDWRVYAGIGAGAAVAAVIGGRMVWKKIK